MNTKLIFIRHGELEGEDSSILHGLNEPVSLSEEGKKTMSDLVSLLEDKNLVLIASSNEVRTRESAEILASALLVPVSSIADLQGRIWGEFAGKSWSDVGKILADKTLEERFEFKPPHGESWKEFENRVLGALDLITKDFEGKTVCIVSHGSTIRVLLPKVFGVTIEDSLKMYPEYGSISTVEYDGQNYINPEFNI